MPDAPPPRSPLLFRRWSFRGARPFHGGATTNAKTGEHYEGSGYGVGTTQDTAAIARPGSHGRRLAHEQAAQRRLAERHGAELRSGYYVGSWREGSAIHYDPSEVVTSLDEAIKRGCARNQQSIYDFGSGKTISLEGKC